MSKNIVICLDGTWNGPDVKATDGTYTPTNVQKVFELLAGSVQLLAIANEMEIFFPTGAGTPRQVAKYIHGVGDAASNPIARACAGALGLGLVGRVIRGYTYLSRVYEAGDQIYIVGFSRGAYAARALAGLVVSQGLLDWQSMHLDAQSEASYSAGLAVWERYKATAHSGDHGVMHGIAEMVTRVHDEIELGLHPAPPLVLVPEIKIKAVAVWDTVGALGIPDVKEQDGTPVRIDVFGFADTKLNASVANGFHAISVDEQRVDFTPSIWNTRDGVVQVLFPGAHADVGGGYLPKESGLANCALVWMVRQLASVGVLFQGPATDVPNPRDIQHTPWLSGDVPYREGARHFPPGLRLSQCVLQRIAVTAPGVEVESLGTELYQPKNLTNSYVMLDWSAPAPHVQVEP